MTSIIDRWRRLQEEVAEAAERYHRPSDSVTIIGVSKYADVAQTAELIRAGCRDLGESRPQSLWEKAAAIGTDSVRWHLIGHLQRNKSRRILPWVHCIHSIDSLRLIEQIEA
ncbi:MAG: YggS family pyridoxal phosphate-dependent enzyme, partial [Pirellulaceae bacterium]